MKHKITKILVALSLSVVLGGSLAACENETTDALTSSGKRVKKLDSKKEPKDDLKSGTYKLVYFDQDNDYYYTSNGDKDPVADFGLVVNGKTKEYKIKITHVIEHVGLKYADSPYVKVGKDPESKVRTIVTVYRGPYQQYIQTDVSGTVTDK